MGFCMAWTADKGNVTGRIKRPHCRQKSAIYHVGIEEEYEPRFEKRKVHLSSARTSSISASV